MKDISPVDTYVPMDTWPELQADYGNTRDKLKKRKSKNCQFLNFQEDFLDLQGSQRLVKSGNYQGVWKIGLNLQKIRELSENKGIALGIFQRHHGITGWRE